jgi:hypothetical protein
MPTPAEQLPPDVATLARKVRALEREMSEMRAARRLESAAIGAGGLKITKGGRLATETPDGQRVLDSGAISNASYNHVDGTPQQALFIRREDGSAALSVFASAGSGARQFLALWDTSGTIIVSDDAISGVGLARPYLPVTLSPAIGTGWDYWPRTTASTMGDLLVGQIYRQQPQLAVVVVAATAGFFTFTADLTTYDHMSQVAVSVAGRRTAGTGALRAQFYTASTLQS